MESTFGLVGYSPDPALQPITPKPAYFALATLATLFARLRFVAVVPAPQPVVALRFESDDHLSTATAVWSPGPATMVSLPAAAGARIVDLFGQSRAAEVVGGRTVLLAEGRPSYVVSP
jgi:hypothetical protein